MRAKHSFSNGLPELLKANPKQAWALITLKQRGGEVLVSLEAYTSHCDQLFNKPAITPSPIAQEIDLSQLPFTEESIAEALD